MADKNIDLNIDATTPETVAAPKPEGYSQADGSFTFPENA
jgi:hypothetical protein